MIASEIEALSMTLMSGKELVIDGQKLEMNIIPLMPDDKPCFVEVNGAKIRIQQLPFIRLSIFMSDSYPSHSPPEVKVLGSFYSRYST
jgi:hypothetical protein